MLLLSYATPLRAGQVRQLQLRTGLLIIMRGEGVARVLSQIVWIGLILLVVQPKMCGLNIGILHKMSYDGMRGTLKPALTQPRI